MRMRWIGSFTWGIGARGQPKTPSKSLKSCLLAVILPYSGTGKLLPLPENPFCSRNHSRIISHDLSFLLPSSCISGSGPSIRGVKVCVHHLCFLRALEPMSVCRYWASENYCWRWCDINVVAKMAGIYIKEVTIVVSYSNEERDKRNRLSVQRQRMVYYNTDLYVGMSFTLFFFSLLDCPCRFICIGIFSSNSKLSPTWMD